MISQVRFSNQLLRYGSQLRVHHGLDDISQAKNKWRSSGEQVEMEWLSFRKHKTSGEQVEMDLDVSIKQVEIKWRTSGDGPGCHFASIKQVEMVMYVISQA